MFIAGIGTQADTIEDRSIIIELRRRLPSEKVAKCPVDLFEQSQALRQKCLRWAEDNIARLKMADFELPDCGNDRAADNWFPLFAIAKALGQQWETKVMNAYVEKNSITEDEAVGVMLLRDIKEAFDSKNWLKMHSDDLVDYLVELEDRPWPEWKRGKPITKTSLSGLLKPYKIKSKQVRIGDRNRRGYLREQFDDAWKRYVSDEHTPSPVVTPSQSATTLQPLLHRALPQSQNATGLPCVASLKSLKALQGAPCSVVTLSEGVSLGRQSQVTN